MRISRRRRWTVLAGFLVVIFFAARWMTWNRLRPVIAWGTDRFAGMRVDILGDLRVLPNGNAMIDAENVRVTDKRDGKDRKPFFEADQLTVVWRLPKLRQSSITLKESTLGSARLYLDRFSTPSESTTDAESKKATESPWHVTWRRLEVPSFTLFKDDKVVAKLKGHIDGRMAFAPFELQGQAAVSGNDLRGTLAAFGYLMTDQIAKYDLAGQISYTPDRLQVKNLDARIQNSALKGSDLTLTFAPKLDVRTFLNFETLQFKDLGAFLPKKMEEELPATRLKTERPSLYSQAEIATDWMHGPHLNIQAKVDRFIGQGKASLIKSFDLKVLMADGKFTVSVPRSSIMDGDVRADLALATEATGLTARLSGSARQMQTGRLFQEFLTSDEMKKKKVGKLTADQLFEGRMDAFLDVHGKGSSMSQIMGTLDGNAGVYVGEGKVSSLLVEILGLDLTESLGVLLNRSQKVGMQCAIVGAKADNGKLTFEPAFISTSDSDLLAKGDLDLKTEEAKLEFRTYPKDPSLGSLRTPIFLRGKLVEPQISLDKKQLAGRLAVGIALGLLNPAASLLATIEPGNAPERSCATFRQKLLSLRSAH